MVKTNSHTEFNFNFEGFGSFDYINNELILLNEMLESADLPFMVTKRIYAISIELLYNTIYHGVKFKTDKPNLSFSITSDKKSIYIKSSNFISHPEVENLRNTLCKLNSYSFDELRKIKGNQIKNGGITKKGGAGLGLIDICMKSSDIVETNFKTINSELDWLSLEVIIDLV